MRARGASGRLIKAVDKAARIRQTRRGAFQPLSGPKFPTIAPPFIRETLQVRRAGQKAQKNARERMRYRRRPEDLKDLRDPFAPAAERECFLAPPKSLSEAAAAPPPLLASALPENRPRLEAALEEPSARTRGPPRRAKRPAGRIKFNEMHPAAVCAQTRPPGTAGPTRLAN